MMKKGNKTYGLHYLLSSRMSGGRKDKWGFRFKEQDKKKKGYSSKVHSNKSARKEKGL